MASFRARLRPGALPLLPFAPGVVVLLGVAVTVAMVLFGLVQLRRTSDDGASEMARVLAASLATRLRVVAEEDREAVVDHVARVTGTDVMLVDSRGTIVADSSPEPDAPLVEMLIAGAGFVDTSTGRASYAVEPLEAPLSHLSLIVLVHAPAAPPGARGLARSVLLLAALLIGIAAYAAYVFSKSAHDDVEFVSARIARMADATGDPVGQPVPIRNFDQVGVVTSAFNTLLERFAAAERAYERDLGQAEALDRARARFLTTLSHELRTPLNAILGFADVLLSEVEGELTASAREDLEVIRSSGEHLRTLIDDILDLSAMEMGSLRLERKGIDLRRIAEDVVREAQPLVSGRPVRVAIAGDPGAHAYADPRRVRQIIANLVGNAVKFTREGLVRVVVRAEGPLAVVEVSDTGPGIAEGERAAIFEEFGQVGEVASRRQGTGLGLAIARRLTAAHEGKLSLSSEVGRGSTFRVELPVEPPPPSSRRPSGRPSQPSSSRPPGRTSSRPPPRGAA